MGVNNAQRAIDHFWMRVPSARSLASTVEARFKGLGGNPPQSWKVDMPLMVEMWLQTSWREESRLAYMVIVEPFWRRTRMVVTSRFLLGSRMKFSAALDFLENFASLAGSDRETPFPENSTQAGGGGGTYFSSVLSERLTESSPFGYLALSSGGILPSFKIFMNSLFFGSLQSLNSPSSMLKPFSQSVILQTLLLLDFYFLANSSGVLCQLQQYVEFFSALDMMPATSGLMTAMPLLSPPVQELVVFFLSSDLSGQGCGYLLS